MQTFTSQRQVTSQKRQVYVGDKSSYVDLFSPAPSTDIVPDSTAEGFEGSGTSLTVPHTCSGTDLVLFVSLWIWNGTIANETVEYNGVPMVLFGQVNADSGILYIYGLVNPDLGTNDIVVTNDNNVQIFICSASYRNVDQTTPFPTVDSGTIGGITFSIPLTTVNNNSWLVMVGRSPSRNAEPSAGTVVRKRNTISGDAGWILDSGSGRSLGANTLDYYYDPSSAQTTYFVIVEMKALDSVPIPFSSVFTCYLRPLNELQSAENGVQYGLGFQVIVECEVDIREGDKITIEGVEYTLRGVVNHDRGGATRYKRAVGVKAENQ